jgi:hypothetical protein
MDGLEFLVLCSWVGGGLLEEGKPVRLPSIFVFVGGRT